MGGIQSAIDRKKQERSNERMAEAGIDPVAFVREDRPPPDFPSAGESTIFFQRVSPAYTKKHANAKFRIGNRDKLSWAERVDLPAYSPDSVRALYGDEAWVRAKELLKATYKGDTDKLVEMAYNTIKKQEKRPSVRRLVYHALRHEGDRKSVV